MLFNVKDFVALATLCPYCGTGIDRIGDSEYPVSVKRCLAANTPLPACPVVCGVPIPVRYCCQPCGCYVSANYIYAFLAQRSQGGTGLVYTYDLAKQEELVDDATDCLTRLHIFVPGTAMELMAKETWTDIVATQLFALSREIVPTAANSTLIYLQPNGMYCRTPAYPEQAACLRVPADVSAYVASNAGLLSLVDFEPVTAEILFSTRKPRRRAIRRINTEETDAT